MLFVVKKIARGALVLMAAIRYHVFMISYLAGWSRKKDSVFECVAHAAGGGRRLSFIPMSLRNYPDTSRRVDQALRVAKRQPRSSLGRTLKRALIALQYNGARRYFSTHDDHIVLCWNGQTGSRRAFMSGAKDAGARTLYAELAPFPNRITLDPAGVNAENSLPKNAEFYENWARSHPEIEPESWREMSQNLTARTSRRKDVAQAGGDTLKDIGPFLFVPLQVPNDSQITAFGGWTKTLEGMIAALDSAAHALPEGWHIRIKEHPSAKTPLTDALARTGERIVVDNQTDTFAQVAASGGVITINSSVGLQAFFYDKPVVVLGQAFFAIPDLVHVAKDAPTLATLMSKADQLSFDPKLRSAFMNYLDQVYYPRTKPGENGALEVDMKDIQAKLTLLSAK